MPAAAKATILQHQIFSLFLASVYHALVTWRKSAILKNLFDFILTFSSKTQTLVKVDIIQRSINFH
jgi:hypothetical protein